MRRQDRGHLRMARVEAHAPGVEPLAQLIRQAMDAAGYNQADVARLTGLHPQLVSQIVNRTKPYGRAPKVETQQALAKIPGLSIKDVAEAILRSTGQPLPELAEFGATMTATRRNLHAVVDKIPEGELNRALQILVALIR